MFHVKQSCQARSASSGFRSEEHTSELQSQSNLVCRLLLEKKTEWTKDRLRDNELVNRIREKVDTWRKGGHAGVTATTARLLEYWTAPDRDRQLFFCQIGALETAIYLNEVASKYGDAWIENQLREANETGGDPQAFRGSLQMGSGAG